MKNITKGIIGKNIMDINIKNIYEQLQMFCDVFL